LILNRYLIREIGKPMIVGATMLIALFASYSAAHFLSDAVNGILPARTVIALTALKTLIALEVLLPIALYLAVVTALGRLYTDSEMTAMAAAGVAPARISKAVAYVAVSLAVLVGCLSFYLRPWAYAESYLLEARAGATIDLDKIEAGTFYATPNGDRVIFVGKRPHHGQHADNVFIQEPAGDATRVLYARHGYLTGQDAAGRPIVVLVDGHMYDINRHGLRDRITHFKRLAFDLKAPRNIKISHQHKAASSIALAHSNAPADIAEFEWRLSTPWSTMLLGLLGVPLSRTRVRGSRYAQTVLAVLVYAAYYALTIAVRTWVEQGVLGAVPGVFLAPLLLFIVLLGAWFKPASMRLIRSRTPRLLFRRQSRQRRRARQ
jgi:lipopolysaccharide export system permease protein